MLTAASTKKVMALQGLSEAHEECRKAVGLADAAGFEAAAAVKDVEEFAHRACVAEEKLESLQSSASKAEEDAGRFHAEVNNHQEVLRKESDLSAGAFSCLRDMLSLAGTTFHPRVMKVLGLLEEMSAIPQRVKRLVRHQAL